MKPRDIFKLLFTVWPNLIIDLKLIKITGVCAAADEEGDVKVEDDIGKSRDGSRTDDETVQR